MTTCDPQIRKWKSFDLYTCEGCRVRTLDAEAFARRCRGIAPAPEPEPDVEPADGAEQPEQPEQTTPWSHDDL